MKNLLLSSFIAVTLAACTFGHYGRLKPATNAAEVTELQPHSVFGDNFNSFLFKTNITLYGNDFSGLLVTKQMAPRDYRVIFTTELGMKLFDFEFRDSKDSAFTLHYCVPQFNRPKLLNVIREDIQTLLMNDVKNKKFDDLQDPEGVHLVYKSTQDKRDYYYFMDRTSGHLISIEKAKKRIKKTLFTLSDYTNDFPNHILIRHYDLKLKIELNLLKK